MRFFFAIPSNPRRQNYRLIELINRNYLGRSESIVWAYVDDAAITPTLVADVEFGDQMLRVPYSGRLQELVAAFEADVRPVAAGWTAYRQAAVSHDRGEWSDIIPFEIIGPVDLQHTVRLARAVRSCLLSACPDPIPSWVSGHAADGDRLRDSHVAVVPLANVGHEHGDGRILGVGLLVPSAVATGERLRAFENFCQIPQRIGEHVTLRRVESSRATLSPNRWTRASRSWGTITPIACHRWPKRGRVVEVVRRDIEQAGLPEPERIEVCKTTPLKGGLFGELTDAPKRYRTHAVIRWREPVAGPIAIGAGRYLGLGFCGGMGA
jgi:CRISPR-associated protein Csb2